MPHHFRWTSTRKWLPADPADASATSDFEKYLSIEPDLAHVAEQDPAAREERMRQLRALGYLEAGEEEEAPEAR